MEIFEPPALDEATKKASKPTVNCITVNKLNFKLRKLRMIYLPEF